MIPLSFVPPLLPDELLYSWLSRVLVLNAMNYWPTVNMARFFGNKQALPGIDLPTHLVNLACNLGSNMPCQSLQTMLDTTTMYPYYRPFLAPDRERAVREMMYSGNGRALKAKLGIVSSGLGALPPLRSCSVCIAADIRRYGCTYWHRLHQLPGIILCPTHATPLADSFVRQTSQSRQAFVLPRLPNDPTIAPPPHSTVLRFVSLSKELFESNLSSIDTDIRTKAYKFALENAGFRRGTRINFRDLTSKLSTYYDQFDGFPFSGKLRRTTNNVLSWLYQMLEYPQCSMHPAYHLFLIGYLFGDIDQFKHALEHPPQVVQLMREPQFSSSLYRSRPIGTPEIAQLHQQHLFHHRRELQSLEHDDETQPSSEFIACLSGVPVAGTCFLAPQEAADTVRIAKRDSLTKMHRRLWTLTAQDHAGAGICGIGSYCRKTHRWLRDHDPVWFRSACQDLRINHGSPSRVNWIERDNELCARVDDLLPTLQATFATRRITATSLMRELGKAHVMTTKRLNRLPRLCAKLAQISESHQAFQIRKVDACARVIRSRDGLVTVRKLREYAGIRSWYPEALAYARILCAGEHTVEACQENSSISSA